MTDEDRLKGRETGMAGRQNGMSTVRFRGADVGVGGLDVRFDILDRNGNVAASYRVASSRQADPSFDAMILAAHQMMIRDLRRWADELDQDARMYEQQARRPAAP